MNAPKVRAFNFCPALQLQGRTFSFCSISERKKRTSNSKSFCRRCCRIIRRKEYNIYLYSFILYVYITFVISIRAREENPIGDIICAEFSSFEKPLRVGCSKSRNNPMLKLRDFGLVKLLAFNA